MGQGGEDLETIRQRALECGAAEAIVADVKDEFAADYCLPALRANALYMDKYPLVSALSRPVIVAHLAKVAKETEPRGRARLHRQGQRPGQVRGRHRGPGPGRQGVRAGPRLGDDQGQGDRVRGGQALPIDVTKKSPYSVDQNAWGRSIETGHLEDIWEAPHDDVYSYTADPAGRRAPRRS